MNDLKLRNPHEPLRTTNLDISKTEEDAATTVSDAAAVSKKQKTSSVTLTASGFDSDGLVVKGPGGRRGEYLPAVKVDGSGGPLIAND